MEKSRKILKVSFGVLILTSISLVFYYFFPVVFAWIGPTQNPPGGDVDIKQTCQTIFGDWCVGEELDYSGQAEVMYDDYMKALDPAHTRPFLSEWTQTSITPEIWKDERTGLYWTGDLGLFSNFFTISTCDFYSMARGAYTGGDTDCGDAINVCATANGASYGGRTGWYLPSLYELMQASLDGMYIQTNEGFTIGTSFMFWSSTELSEDDTTAWMGAVSHGYLFPGWGGKVDDTSTGVRCVSRD